MTDILNSVSTGVIDSIVFASLIYFIQLYRYKRRLKNKFNNRIFYSSYKEVPGEIVQTIKLTVEQNIIKFSGKRTMDEDSFEGEIIMNPINLKIGEGFHAHKDSEGFGFIKVIIKDNDTFLVEAPFTKINKEDKSGTEIQQAFIWSRKR